MDLGKIVGAAEEIISNATDAAKKVSASDIATKVVGMASQAANAVGGAANIPGVAQVTNAVQGAVAEAKAKADDMGLSSVFEQTENAVEKKVGMDLDGDGDTGVANTK